MPTRFTKKHIDRCVESATYQTGGLKLDREAGIVSGVKVLGWSGKGGQRIYQRRAVEQALPLYDGVVVNLNHVKVSETDMSQPNRSVTERFGRIINPEIREDGLYGDLKFNRKHYWADTFIGWVESDPGAIGLSHDAILQGPMLKDGKRNIESIPKVFSVDIVADPGSTHGLHEDATPDEPESEASTGMEDLEEPNDAEEHLCSFIVSLIKDKSLSMAERKAKVMEAMKLLDDDDEEGEEPEEEESDEKDEPEEKPESKDKPEKKMETPSKESLALNDAERAELDAYRADKARRAQESKAREKCKVADLDEYLVTDTFVDVLARAQESQWETLIADRKLQVGSSEPRSTLPTGGKGKTVTLEDFEKHMLGKGK